MPYYILKSSLLCRFRSLLLLAGLSLALQASAQSVTFYKDVQPIVYKNCVVCHRPGEAAPFSLITYEDVSKRAKFIREVVSTRYMPPWRADNHYTDFANDRSLDEKEIATIVAWIDASTQRKRKIGPGKSAARAHQRRNGLPPQARLDDRDGRAVCVKWRWQGAVHGIQNSI